MIGFLFNKLTKKSYVVQKKPQHGSEQVGFVMSFVLALGINLGCKGEILYWQGNFSDLQYHLMHRRYFLTKIVENYEFAIVIITQRQSVSKRDKNICNLL